LNEKKTITESDLVKLLAAYELLDEVKLVVKENGERTK
jgi:hypothetical protein